ncbi:MAG: 2'-5' RNA ligase family protein [Erythrobacter sp.]
MVDVPLIMTAQLPPDLQREYTALRTRHFPPERNFLDAHVTLFHALPAHYEAEVIAACQSLAAQYGPIAGEVQGLMSLGRGTAIRLVSPGILRIRDELASRFHGLLTSQDQHRPRLHVTIQNKVSPQEARVLLAALEGSVTQQGFAFRGLALHRYRGGPWEPLREFSFRGHEKA